MNKITGRKNDATTSKATLMHTIAGGTSGCLTRMVLQPLDVIKIRLQLQSATGSHQAKKYKNMFHAARIIIREEAFKSLWKGHVPAQLLSIIYGVVQFVSYEKFTNFKIFRNQRERPFWLTATPFICGGCAGVCATLTAYPLDVLRTRLVAQSQTKVYSGLSDAIRKMYLEQGLRTFYKGTLPTLIAIFPNAGCQFGFYKLFKSLWERLFIKKDPGDVNKLESILCGAASGLASKVLLLPFDTVKKRLQIVGFKMNTNSGLALHYTGMLDCCQKIFCNEGITGFYKGTGPSMVKAALSVSLTFFFYEQCCHSLKVIFTES